LGLTLVSPPVPWKNDLTQLGFAMTPGTEVSRATASRTAGVAPAKVPDRVAAAERVFVSRR
jgi:hypothetical protein